MKIGIVDSLDAFDIHDRTTSAWSSKPSASQTLLLRQHISLRRRHSSGTKAYAALAHAAPAHSPDNPGTAVTAPPTPRTSALLGTAAPIRREPEAEMKDVAEALEAAAAE